MSTGVKHVMLVKLNSWFILLFIHFIFPFVFIHNLLKKLNLPRQQINKKATLRSKKTIVKHSNLSLTYCGFDKLMQFHNILHISVQSRKNFFPRFYIADGSVRPLHKVLFRTSQ